MPDEENDERAVLEIADDTIVAHAKAVLADGSTHEGLSDLQWILLRAVPVELLGQLLLHIPGSFSAREGHGT